MRASVSEGFEETFFVQFNFLIRFLSFELKALNTCDL